MSLPWNEMVPTLSIHPDAACLEDIARMAAELMEARSALVRLRQEIKGLTERLARAEEVMPRVVVDEHFGIEGRMVQFGPYCAISTDALLKERGPIVRENFREWVDSLAAYDAAKGESPSISGEVERPSKSGCISPPEPPPPQYVPPPRCTAVRGTVRCVSPVGHSGYHVNADLSVTWIESITVEAERRAREAQPENDYIAGPGGEWHPDPDATCATCRHKLRDHYPKTAAAKPRCIGLVEDYSTGKLVGLPTCACMEFVPHSAFDACWTRHSPNETVSAPSVQWIDGPTYSQKEVEALLVGLRDRASVEARLISCVQIAENILALPLFTPEPETEVKRLTERAKREGK